MCVNNNSAQKDGLVDITGLSISDVLAALYNAVAPLRFGFADSLNGPKVMDADTSKQIILSNKSYYFERLFGRILVVNLDKDTPNFDGREFDKYHGKGSAARIIKRLKSTGDINSKESINDHKSEFLENYPDALCAAAYFAYDFSGTRMLVGNTTVNTCELYGLVQDAVNSYLEFLFPK